MSDSINVFATVGAVYSDGVSLIFDGEDAATEKHYKVNAGCSFSAGDRVKLDAVDGTYVAAYVVGSPGVASSAFPVGSIFLSVVETSPSTLLGYGTWVRVTEKFLLGASMSYPAGTTGGSETVTLTEAQTPRHNHSTPSSKHTHSLSNLAVSIGSSTGTHKHKLGAWLQAYFMMSTSYVSGYIQKKFIENPTYSYQYTDMPSTADGGHTHTATVSGSASETVIAAGSTGYAGGGQAHNNMPPYLAVYIWKRTA